MTNKHYSPQYKRFYDDSYYYKDHEYKPSRRNYYTLRPKGDPLYYLRRRAQVAHDLAQKTCNICPSGWSAGQGWAALYRAWLGFILRKNDDDEEGMVTYAMSIRRIQKDLNIQMNQFTELKLAALEYANDPENKDILDEAAEDQDKDPEDLNSEDILNTMMSQDRLAYELAGMDYY